MTKNEFIIQAVLSLNNGDSGWGDDRVEIAIKQYNQLVENGIKFESEHKWIRPKPDKDK